MPKFYNRWLLPVISSISTIIIIEILLTLFFPIDYMQPPQALTEDSWRLLLHRPSEIPGLAYELAPNRISTAVGVLAETNSFGFRDDEPRIQDDLPDFRIVAVGDSFTFGYGVESHETYPNILEDLLNESFGEKPFEILNLGVSSYSSHDEALVVEHKAIQWQPDLIIIGYVLNDPEIDPVQPIHQYFQDPLWWQYSNILRLIFQVKNTWDIERLGDGNYLRYLHAPEERKWKSVTTGFEKIASVAREHKIPVLLLIFPRFGMTKNWSQYPFNDLHTQVAEAASEEGIFVIDLLEEYSKYAPIELRASIDNAHPGPLANDVAAKEIQAWLMNKSQVLSVPRLEDQDAGQSE